MNTLPCQVCGRKPTVYPNGYVSCFDCDSYAPSIASWNRFQIRQRIVYTASVLLVAVGLLAIAVLLLLT